MPTPPKETMGGSKPHQIASFDFHKAQYNYIAAMEEFKLTSDFELLSEREVINHEVNIENQTNAYELLREIVEEY